MKVIQMIIEMNNCSMTIGNIGTDQQIAMDEIAEWMRLAETAIIEIAEALGEIVEVIMTQIEAGQIKI